MKLTAAQRTAVRKAIARHPGWTAAFRAENNYGTLDALQARDYPAICAQLGIDMHAVANAPLPDPRPDPRPAPEQPLPGTHGMQLLERLNKVQDFVSVKAFAFATDILMTVITKQAGRFSHRQEEIVLDIIRKGEQQPLGTAPKVEPFVSATLPTTEKAPDMPATQNDIAAQISAALAPLFAQLGKPALDEGRVVELVREHSATPATIHLDLTTPDGLKVEMKDQLIHHMFPALLAAVSAGVNVMLVGPAGSGKTKAAEMVAEALGLEFGFTGALDTKYGLTGFTDAQGRIVETPFVRAYRDGGLFLFDEIDGSMPGPVLSFNAALANGHADLPAGMVPRHPNFRCIAAANTYGRGADRQYVGRNQLDAASLDRYVILNWEYDAGLEAAMVGLPRPAGAPAPVGIAPITDEANMIRTAQRWLDRVQAVRKAVADLKIRHVVSPRATQAGVKLLAAGWSWALVEEGCLFKGLDADSRAKIRAAA